MSGFSLEAGAAALDWLRACGEAPQGWRATEFDNPGGERFVAEVALYGAAGERGGQTRSVVAKGYPDDSGARTFDTMQMLHAALSRRSDGTLRVPQAHWYDAARRCLVQEFACGERFDALRGGAGFAAALELAGRALAELHRLEVAAGAAKGMAEQVAELMRPHPLELGARLPHLRARIETLLARLCAAVPADVAAVPLHRDFHLRQLFLDGRQVWVLDWDLFGCGDPALDVGNFDMSLELKDVAASDRAAFLAGYVAVRPDPGVLARVGVYRAFKALRRACKHCRQHGGDWTVQSERMVAAAERELARTLPEGVQA
jgi:aminoglycoside phosphotransferase (APT) family kinase protein